MLKVTQCLITSLWCTLVGPCTFGICLYLPEVRGAIFPAVADGFEQATVAEGEGVAARHVRGAAVH